MENSYGKIPATDSKKYIATTHKYTLFTIISNKILHKKFKYLYYYSNLFNTLYIIVKFRNTYFLAVFCTALYLQLLRTHYFLSCTLQCKKMNKSRYNGN